MSSDRYFSLPPPPPPPPMNFEDMHTPRSAFSRTSFISDVTMTDGFADDESLTEEGNSLHQPSTASVLEYSDTSEEPSSRKSRKLTAANVHRNEKNLLKMVASRSTFRPRKDFLGRDHSRGVKALKAVDRDDLNAPDGKYDEEDPPRNKNSSKRHALLAAQNRPHAKKETSRPRHNHRHHDSREDREQERLESSSGGAGWMTQLAYSFRSPSPRAQEGHRRSPSGTVQEYPHFFPDKGEVFTEQSRLLAQHDKISFTDSSTAPKKVQTDFIAIAATFLKDYDGNRPPTFAYRQLDEISQRQVQLYNLRYGNVAYSCTMALATLALFSSCFCEGFYNQYFHRMFLTYLNVFALAVYAVDLKVRGQLLKPRGRDTYHRVLKESQTNKGMDRLVRRAYSPCLAKPLILFGAVLMIENFARLLVTPGDSLVLFTSFFKPIVFYYVSSQARESAEALGRIIRGVSRVLLMEILIILIFAAIACRFFSDFDRFRNLSTSWLALFELSTSVGNPGFWMPVYENSEGSALFFIFFAVVTIFYLHALTLSVVFQSYIHAAAEFRERSALDREEALKMAFMTLRCHQQQSSTVTRSETIEVTLVRDTLQLVRPHYSAMKINALVEIVAPTSQTTVDYPTFRTKIRQALNASVRTARNASTVAMATEIVAAAVAVINFVYVISAASVDSNSWFNSMKEYLGCGITFVAGFELLIRFNPFRIRDFTPLTRLNATFDGIALAAVLISCYGIFLFLLGNSKAADYILVGRAVDIIRVMRFFQSFRDLVRRSSDVFPSLLGPLILVITTVHAFVYAGMALWGGGVDVDSNGLIHQIRYELNNFNSYREGVVTMFQVLVVNDWDKLTEIFLSASRCSNPLIVYTFFVSANLIGVSIMLNVLTAFFVETFITKFNDDTDGPAETSATVHKDKENIKASLDVAPLKEILQKAALKRKKSQDEDSSSEHDADSEGSSESELYQFDIYEREGLDKIMQTVTDSSDDNHHFGRLLCSYFEIFESLSPGRESVGWLICDQQTLDRFGNRRFQTKAAAFLTEAELQVVVSNMHSELLALAPKASFQDSSLIRRFPHREGSAESLEIAASLLRRHPALSLFVSRVVKENGLEATQVQDT